MATAALPGTHDPIDAELETLLTSFDTNYAWNYGNVKEGLRDLYEKAKREQWNATEQLAWETPVDPLAELIPNEINPFQDYEPFHKLTDSEREKFRHALLSWQLSQFMHGEQGALITASQLVGAVPWMDAKYYASTQTMDEARHVEVFSRYLHEKLEWEWPINENLKTLLDLILMDSRWDFKYLGMQILVEGLAMAAFGNLYNTTLEPLLKDLIHYVMRDESRHVAFGVLSLKGYYDDMPAHERRDREDFVIEACHLMRDRLIGEEVADVVGFDRADFREKMMSSPFFVMFRQSLFARVVPNIKRLGLLTPHVRQSFEELQIIQFEDADPEAQDRELGFA
ncbi:hypothetical protein MK489_17490 [Myxococcota bacterium]|nr:hypothetical protein [Myxococcota bacterium]